MDSERRGQAGARGGGGYRTWWNKGREGMERMKERKEWREGGRKREGGKELCLVFGCYPRLCPVR